MQPSSAFYIFPTAYKFFLTEWMIWGAGEGRHNTDTISSTMPFPHRLSLRVLSLLQLLGLVSVITVSRCSLCTHESIARDEEARPDRERSSCLL